jgi:hypothetical protein
VIKRRAGAQAGTLALQPQPNQFTPNLINLYETACSYGLPAVEKIFVKSEKKRSLFCAFLCFFCDGFLFRYCFQEFPNNFPAKARDRREDAPLITCAFKPASFAVANN